MHARRGKQSLSARLSYLITVMVVIDCHGCRLTIVLASHWHRSRIGLLLFTLNSLSDSAGSRESNSEYIRAAHSSSPSFRPARPPLHLLLASRPTARPR